MIRYLLQRLAAMVPTLLGITVITFVVISIAPGDPVQASFGTGGAGAGEESGSGDQDRLADAIKAKQQLLGIMAEDHALLAFSAQGASTDEATPWGHARFAILEQWARSLALDGSDLWVGTHDGKLLRLDASGSVQATVDAHPDSVWAVVAYEGGIATADKRGNIALWARTGESIARIDGDGRAVRSLAAQANTVYAASDSGPIRALDGADGRVTRTFGPHNGPVFAVAVKDGKLYSGGTDRRLIISDTATGKVIGDGPLHGGAINDIDISGDGAWMATAADDRVVRRMALTDGIPGEATEFKGHYKKVTAVAIGEGGSPLISGSGDELLRTWNVATGNADGLAGETTGVFHDLVLYNGQPVAAGAFWYKVPVIKRYLRWLGRLVTLDFGRSFVDDERVIDKIRVALPVTISLNIVAIFIIYLVSVPLGIYAAVKRGQAFDNGSSVILFVLYSIPNFWLATMLIMFFSSSIWWDVFPSGKLHSTDPWSMSYLPWLADFGWHLVLPITVMVYAGFASLSRYVRTSMLEALSQDFVRTARAKGLSELVVVGKHAFRNALITIITLIGNLLPRMIGGSVIVEYIFSIDGMGKLGFDAILSRDYPVIMAITTFAAVLTLLGILVSDLLYGAVDPRVRVNQ